MYINWLELIPIRVPSRSMSNRSGYQGSFMMNGYMVRKNIPLVQEYEYTNGRIVSVTKFCNLKVFTATSPRISFSVDVGIRIMEY